MVPATKKLQLGVVDPDVVALRKRLMVSGDLSTSAGISQSFDTYVDAAVKRFQARHGLPADGVHRQIFLRRDERFGAECGSASSRPILCACARCRAISASAT